MLKGDLASTPLAPLLLQLAEDLSTGCLHISDGQGDEALAYFKNGLVYAVSVPGHRPQLGAKLVSSGALVPEALADALEAQRTELQGWRLGELLVHLGYVDQPVVEAFVKEQVHDALWDLIKWVDGPWKFRKNEKTREDVAPPMSVAEILTDLRERGAEWQTISTVVHGPAAVPVLSTRGGGSPEATLDPDAWSMLCKIDGVRSVAELAHDCGYTMFEAGQVLVALVNAGLVDIEEDLEVVLDAVTVDDGDALYGATSVRSALAAEAAAAAGSPAGEPEAEDSYTALERLVTEVAASLRDDEVGSQPEHVAETPSQVRLYAGNDESFAASIERVSEALAIALGPAPAMADPYEVPHELRVRAARTAGPIDEETARKTRARQAAAAELAAAHALAEALHAAQIEETNLPAEDAEPVATVVDLAEVRREAEAARVAVEEEAARLEAERLAAEQEAERVAAEQEAERVAAEEAARAAAEEEAARLAAEQEAARLEAERLAAEQEAARAAEEEAARLEAERLAAEQEAARVAAEEEAARVAAEEEAARLAAEQEAARLEAERLAAEQAARLATERANAEDEAWAEYWAREARDAEAASQRGAAASALLTQLSAEPMPAEEPEPVEDMTEPEPYEPFEPAAEVREPASVGVRATAMAEMTDTAALLRELSSLGVEDDQPSAPAPRSAPPSRPSRPAAVEKKKKRGIFGR